MFIHQGCEFVVILIDSRFNRWRLEISERFTDVTLQILMYNTAPFPAQNGPFRKTWWCSRQIEHNSFVVTWHRVVKDYIRDRYVSVGED